MKKGFLKKKAGGDKAEEPEKAETEEKAQAGEVDKGEEKKEKAGAKEQGGQVEKGEEKKEKAGEAEQVEGEGSLKGKLVRVVEESNVYLGRVVEVVGHAKGKLHGHLAWKDAQEQFLEKTKVPSSVALDEKAVVSLEEIPKPELTPWKSLRFKDEERAEAEDRFPPAEFEHGYKLAKDRSLPLLHMELWLWLLGRDFELRKIERVKLLSPSRLHRICCQMQLPDAAEKLVDEVGTLEQSSKMQS